MLLGLVADEQAKLMAQMGAGAGAGGEGDDDEDDEPEAGKKQPEPEVSSLRGFADE